MAAHVFHTTLAKLIDGSIDLNTDDIRVALLMTNTTADTNTDPNFLTDLTLDECDGSGYVRKSLVTEAVNTDLTNDRAEFDADDVTWTALGNSATGRQIQGYLIYKHVGADSANIPILFRDFAATINPGGNDLVVQWNVEGILQLANV